jgi:DNA-binding transcriptional MerR regulator
MPAKIDVEIEPVLTRAEVAAMFGVVPKTVGDWAVKGKLPTAFRTPGGHRRYSRAGVEALRRRCADEGGGDP